MSKHVKRPKSVALLSGGLDSTIALHWAMQNSDVLCALSVHYGQNHWVEVSRAGHIARKAGVRHEIDQAGARGLGFSALGQTRRSDASDFIPIETAASAVVPARNMILLGIAAMWAEKLGADEIVTGFSRDDARDFPDCRPNFVRAAADCISLSLDRRIRIRTPLIAQTKVMALALAKKIPGCWETLRFTWTCYTPKQAGVHVGHVEPCGTCASCAMRASAFADFGEEDPALGKAVRA